MQKKTDNAELVDRDDWHIHYINPASEETLSLLRNSPQSHIENNKRETAKNVTRAERNSRRCSDKYLAEEAGSGHDDEDKVMPRRAVRCCQPRIYVVLASAMAALGGVLFGYDTGIISGAILQLNDEFDLNCQQTAFLISSLMMGAVAASICGGFLVDCFGRRATIIANDVVFLAGTVILTCSNSYTSLVIGRLIIGFAVSLSATAECVYITEISPPSRRGLLVSLNELGITLGFLAAYLFNFIFIGVQGGWRYMFAIGGVLAIVQGVGMIFLPKSPRYLVLKGEENQAKLVLQSLTEDAEEEFQRIRASVAEEKNLKMSDFLCGGKNSIWAALFISMTLVLLQQISGQPSVLLYAPMIFREVGLETDAASVLATVGLGLIKFLVTVVYLMIIDRVGRRRLLMIGTGTMMVSILGLSMLILKLFPDSRIASSCGDLQPKPMYTTTDAQRPEFETVTHLELTGTNLTTLHPTTSGLHSPAGTWLAMFAVFFYVGGYSIGFGPGTWLVMSEIFASSVRGRAIAFATIINWATQLITSITFLDLILAVGTSWLFFGYAIVCAFATVFIYCVVPETKGKSLELITSEMKHLPDCCCCEGSSGSSTNRTHS